MTKFQKSIVAAVSISLAMALFMPAEDIDNFIFSGFSLGWSAEISEDTENERVEVLDDDAEVEYSFKIADLFSALFD